MSWIVCQTFVTVYSPDSCQHSNTVHFTFVRICLHKFSIKLISLISLLDLDFRLTGPPRSSGASELKPARERWGPRYREDPQPPLPSGPRPPLQQPCGVASQGLRAAFPFCVLSHGIFRQPPSLRNPIISINQTPNVASWLPSLFFPLRPYRPTPRDSGTRALSLNDSQLPSSPADLKVSDLAANSSAALLYELLVRRFQRAQQQRTAAPHHRSIRRLLQRQPTAAGAPSHQGSSSKTKSRQETRVRKISRQPTHLDVPPTQSEASFQPHGFVHQHHLRRRTASTPSSSIPCRAIEGSLSAPSTTAGTGVQSCAARAWLRSFSQLSALGSGHRSGPSTQNVRWWSLVGWTTWTLWMTSEPLERLCGPPVTDRVCCGQDCHMDSLLRHIHPSRCPVAVLSLHFTASSMASASLPFFAVC